jgi:hypothetical protein
MSTAAPSPYPVTIPGTQADRRKTNAATNFRRKQFDGNHQVQPQTVGHPVSRFLVAISVALCLMTGAVLLAVWAIGTELSRAGHAADTTLFQIEIGDDVLDIPANWIRFRSQRHFGKAGRVDLYFHWPEMSGFSDSLDSEFNSEAVNPAIIFVTVEQRRMTLDMSGRIDPIYRKFFIGKPTPSDSGLVRQDLSQTSGYEGEFLAFEADNPHPYAARCVDKSESGATPYCIRDIHLGRNLSVTYRFHASLLGNWKALDRAIRARTSAMMAD